MRPLFSPDANSFALWLLSGLVAGLCLGAALLFWLWRSAYANDVGFAVPQPIPFSHKHHVQGAGLDCRFCHANVEVSATAGMPTTEVCMTCHSQLYSQSPALEELRASWKSGKAIPWNRVHELPDYVYFDHSAHVTHGIACVSCHGAVNEMPLVAKAAPLTMGWCINCHRDPGPALHRADQIYSLTPSRASPKEEAQLKVDYGIGKKDLTGCYTCHR